MRLWSLHPRYLDPSGLVAVWREALLAQKVLQGRTRGYRYHPQLARFRSQPDPGAAIASYLTALHQESVRRGYAFDGARIAVRPCTGTLSCTRGQLAFEWEHLKAKLARRAPEKLKELSSLSRPKPHPLFRIISGPIEPWEVIRAKKVKKRVPGNKKP